MSDIFLSYSRDDQATARRFAEAFEREGLSVWWDVTLNPGEAYDQVTEKALREAKAVVVLWSKKSVDSRWVRAEATTADRNKTLVPVMIELCVRPIMFELTHTVDLSHWMGDASDKAWQSYLAGVRRFVEKTVPGLEVSADDSRTVAIASKSTITKDSPSERVPSIAVLPFANMSGEKEQEYFSDGLAEEIINALAQLPGLKVIARTSAFAFKGQNTDIRRIAETLGVANILEGSVRRSGNRIRVTAQLITATDGSHLWSERYDRELADVFAVQDEIAAAISEALKVRLSPQAAAPRHTPTLPAYEALLKARHFHWRITAEAMEQARPYYEQAVALDPQFALAYAAYADYLFGRTTLGLSPLREVAAKSRFLAQRALELDASLSDAHGLLCCLAATYDYNWKEAHRQFLLAVPEGRGMPLSRMGCGWSYLLASGHPNEAVDQLRLAVQGDPLHLTYRAILAWCLIAAKRYAEAEEVLHLSRDLDSNFIWTYEYLAQLWFARQDFAEAFRFAETVYALAPWYKPGIGLYAGLLVRSGQPERGSELLESQGWEGTYGSAKARALFYTCCGDIDRAAHWYGQAIEERDSQVVAYLQGSMGEPLRRSSHWHELAARMNLTEVQTAFAT